MNANWSKLQLGKTLSELSGDKNNHGDCFNYGSVGGCDEHCPALLQGKCEIYPDVTAFITQEEKTDA